jgi:hypothetical protein
MERRKHQRISTSIPIKVLVSLPGSPEVLSICFGVLHDISFGGVYFRSTDGISLEQGQILDFTITGREERLSSPCPVFMAGTGRVVRIDPQEAGCRDTGVAIELIASRFFDLVTKWG